MDSLPIKRALISVSDKSGLPELARQLTELGVELFSTGGTHRALAEAGIQAVEIADYTQFPEMMEGRLKTLHPKVFGGILARRDREDDLHSLQAQAILPFELVVVNLYPFEATVAQPHTTTEQAIEQIDIGGPSLLRAAAKNHAFVTVVTEPAQYAELLHEMRSKQGSTTVELRQRFATRAFAHTATYDRAIANYFSESVGHELTSVESSSADADRAMPSEVVLRGRCHAQLRYGENPHQQAAVYSSGHPASCSLVLAEQLNGKELSYNNYLDLDAALSIVRALSPPSTAVVKHNNPCGVASGSDLAHATKQAMLGDPVSAFGSVLGLNRVLDEATAETLCAPGHFIEAIVAPDFDPAAVELLTTRPKWKSNVRLIKYGNMTAPSSSLHFRQIDGGLLVQEPDNGEDPQDDWQVPTATRPTDAQLAELRFAWAVVRHVKSNAIVLTRDLALCGAGAGQMSRVDSVEIAINKAGQRAAGAALASDAFFPFPDSIHRAAEAGIAAIIQPGGSRKDGDVIAACDQHDITMVMTGRRHFRH